MGCIDRKVVQAFLWWVLDGSLRHRDLKGTFSFWLPWSSFWVTWPTLRASEMGEQQRTNFSTICKLPLLHHRDYPIAEPAGHKDRKRHCGPVLLRNAGKGSKVVTELRDPQEVEGSIRTVICCVPRVSHIFHVCAK